jgi:hypothetical protein
VNAIVGYTGFVGSNLCENNPFFDALFNSKNIQSSYGLAPELLIYSGVRAEKFLANNSPDQDLNLIIEAESNIRKIQPQKIVLISTIDVYKDPVGVDETTDIDKEGLQPYGLNRYLLECWVRDNFPDSLIVRLPGLFGNNIKKNFIYDYINRIPVFLRKDKYYQLSDEEHELKNFYSLQDNGFYKCKLITDAEREYLKSIFSNIGFSALNFTDSRSIFQFYALSRLWNDIQTALKNGIKLINLVNEPISAGELYQYLASNIFDNELASEPISYDCKTIYSGLFNGSNGYLLDKSSVLKEIKNFIEVR